ncbi:queuine tRNA-ribosyltransferase subunit QTRTD1 [Strigomonas culicis]|nr:queuine tRNA-ribosyltransferase subunit QTRTD1 [Strigomonas culicis]|eukprot:EPY34497.1 queuine tRNA-ribosyltransferase subunit QTRTD1 [Strigomonas culicis]
MCDTIPLGANQTRKQRAAKRRSELWNEACVKKQQNGNCLVVQPYTNDHSSGFVHSIPQSENLLEFAVNLQSLKLSSKSVSIGVAFSIPQLLASLVGRVELIESTIPWDLADKGIALVMDINGDSDKPLSGVSEPQIDLNSAEFTYDIGPLCRDCTCYTCKRHHRAYIHHLLTVQEMNSSILLVIHNLSRMAQLVRKYRTATTDEARANIVKHVITQY